MPSEKRKNQRYQSEAKARIAGLDRGDAFLKDLSIIGCCLVFGMPIDVKPGTQYEIEIFPEEVSGIGIFEILAETKWIHVSDNSMELGFGILESPKGKHFQRYVDYLAWRSGQEHQR